MMRHYGHWIGGVEEPASGGGEIVSTRPGTDEPVCAIAAGNTADVDRAVMAAVAAGPEWRDRKPIDGGRNRGSGDLKVRSAAGAVCSCNDGPLMVADESAGKHLWYHISGARTPGVDTGCGRGMIQAILGNGVEGR